ncbi:MAG TPA: gliding motility-associated C-terminal domain-containing protein, partial [Saprospiraceae bacterium]|nr:gliding motility-associated C-terminal domain-containing protein [Saprospiraceae bacterium]
SSDDYNGYSVPCYGDHLGMAEVKVYQNGTPPLSFQWSTGQTDQSLFNLNAGWYIATVTDSYGCEKRDSILLTEPPPLSFELIGKDLSCFGINDGVIQLANISGGVQPLQNSIQGLPFGSGLIYSNLSAGEYHVILQDKNGCELSDTTTLTSPGPWSLSLGPDTIIGYGSAFNIIPVIFGTPQGVLNSNWSDGECENCLTRTIIPLSTVELTLFAQDENGCTSEDDIRILVHLDRNLFIPNIFSPNGDNINDEFLIGASPALKEIALLTIFDRWGEVVFEADHFQANDPVHAWDGKMDGQLLNPGVFVYQLQAVYIDGKVEDKYGSVTLVR